MEREGHLPTEREYSQLDVALYSQIYYVDDPRGVVVRQEGLEVAVGVPR